VARGTALGAEELVAVFGVTLVLVVRAFAGGVRTAEEGVYSTEVVVAFEPAAAEADEENDVTALAPVVPEDELD
jgi:hypothetical protein